MDFGAVIEIISVFLTVLGIACLSKYISDVFFLPKEVVSTIMILEDKAKENADILLDVANKRMWKWAGRSTCVLVSRKYAGDAELMELIKESGFKMYIIDD